MATLPSGAAVGDCPISADFGEAAETTREQSRVAGKDVVVTLTRAFVEGGMVAVECNNLSVDEAFPGMSDEQILLNYLTFYGLSPLDNGRRGIDHFSKPVPHVSVTGYKEISGAVVVYSYRLFRFASGSATVMVAFPGNATDRNSIARFLESISVD